jgi:hypothetical protein
LAWAMAEAASAQQAAGATREDTSQQRAGRRRRTSADPRRAQQGASAATTAAPAALDSLSRLQQLADASPQVAQLQRLQALVDASPQVAQLQRLQALADASPQVAQLQRLQALADAHYAPVSQLAGTPEEEDLIQGKFATVELQPQLKQAPRTNNTGLPDQLKSGIESLSGLSMDHVRVHYNSAQPAQLNALAYAQGSDIHLAPGQEQHLPHEAWHVVQQRQGRVRPTLQLKDGVPVNDDVGLEREADVMGTKALERGHRADETHRSIPMPIKTAQPIDGDATYSPEVNVANNHSAPLANGRGSAQRGGNEMQRIADQRPEAALQRQVQAWGDGSERVGQLRAWQGVADGRGVGGERQGLTPGFVLMGGRAVQMKEEGDKRQDSTPMPRAAVSQGEPPVQCAKLNLRNTDGTISGVSSFIKRPPSNLGSQGQHLTAYVSFKQTILSRVRDLTPTEAAASLRVVVAEILELPAMQTQNQWNEHIHLSLAEIDAALNDAQSMEQNSAAVMVGKQIDAILRERNRVPGTAISEHGTHGHGEAKTAGALEVMETALRTEHAGDYGASVAQQAVECMWALFDYDPPDPADNDKLQKIQERVLTHVMSMRTAFPKVFNWLTEQPEYWLIPYLSSNRNKFTALQRVSDNNLLQVQEYVHANL